MWRRETESGAHSGGRAENAPADDGKRRKPGCDDGERAENTPADGGGNALPHSDDGERGEPGSDEAKWIGNPKNL